MPQESILGSNYISTEAGNITCENLFNNLNQGNIIKAYTLINNEFILRPIIKYGKLHNRIISNYYFSSNGVIKFVGVTEYAEILLNDQTKLNFIDLMTNDSILSFNNVIKYSLDLNSKYERVLSTSKFENRIEQLEFQDTYYFVLENNLPLIIENSFFIKLPISENF